MTFLCTISEVFQDVTILKPGRTTYDRKFFVNWLLREPRKRPFSGSRRLFDGRLTCPDDNEFSRHVLIDSPLERGCAHQTLNNNTRLHYQRLFHCSIYDLQVTASCISLHRIQNNDEIKRESTFANSSERDIPESSALDDYNLTKCLFNSSLR